ncbi:MAG: hypothetical protein Q9191_002357 [Dirinaria sp. TL-2023a]
MVHITTHPVFYLSTAVGGILSVLAYPGYAFARMELAQRLQRQSEDKLELLRQELADEKASHERTKKAYDEIYSKIKDDLLVESNRVQDVMGDLELEKSKHLWTKVKLNKLDTNNVLLSTENEDLRAHLRDKADLRYRLEKAHKINSAQKDRIAALEEEAAGLRKLSTNSVDKDERVASKVAKGRVAKRQTRKAFGPVSVNLQFQSEPQPQPQAHSCCDHSACLQSGRCWHDLCPFYREAFIKRISELEGPQVHVCCDHSICAQSLQCLHAVCPHHQGAMNRLSELEGRLAQQDKELSELRTRERQLTKSLSEKTDEAASNHAALVDKIMEAQRLSIQIKNLRVERDNLYEMKEKYMTIELGFAEETSIPDCFEEIMKWKHHWDDAGLSSTTEEDEDEGDEDEEEEEDEEDDGDEDEGKGQDPGEENPSPRPKLMLRFSKGAVNAANEGDGKAD